MSEIDLDGVLSKAREGDEASIAALYRSIHPRLLRYLNRRVPGMGEDLASETWLAVARQLPRFEGTADDLRALIFTIARRRAVDHLRRLRRSPRLVADDTCADPAAPEETGELALGSLSAERAVALLTAVLPPLQAEVILLRVVADLSVADVARVIGRSPGAVRVLQHRALRRLAEHASSLAVTN